MKVGHTSTWKSRISGHFRYFPPVVSGHVTEGSPIEEEFYIIISRFSPIGCVNYVHSSPKITFLFICRFHCGFLLRIHILAISLVRNRIHGSNQCRNIDR